MTRGIVAGLFLILSYITPLAAETVTIGYLELAQDARYLERRAYARLHLAPRERPFIATAVAIDETAMMARVADLAFSVERYQAASVADLVSALPRWRILLVDLPAEAVRALAEQAPPGTLLINLTASEDSLRALCRDNLLHAAPSHAMLMDGLVQYLVSRDWRRIFVLRGALPEDALLAAALDRATRRFGAHIVETKPFELGNDPRHRERNNIPLMTNISAEHDVVLVIDSDGEFGRYVPFQTNRPRPVAGTTGLTAEAWHWAWERHGAPQVNSRFAKKAGRRMSGSDWAAWVATKAVVQAAFRTRSADPARIAEYLKGDRIRLDGAKGPPLSFRAWDGQLRQPVLLATHDAVIARTPLPGFLHQTNELDTLGYDAPENACPNSR